MSRRSLNFYQQAHVVAKHIERYLHHRMSALIGNSRAVIDELAVEARNAGPKRIGLIYNGIALRLRGDSDERRACRNALGISDTTLVMVKVANLFPYKGHVDLIDALGGIADRLGPDWVLLCAGRDVGALGNARARAAELGIESRIRWLGELGRREVRSALAAADMALLCSHEEGFPNALLESMAMGLPTIATSVGGVPEIIRDPRLGLLVPPRDPEKLGDAILTLTRDPKLRAAIGTAGQQSVLSRFTIGDFIARHDRLYAGLLSGQASDIQAAIDGDEAVGPADRGAAG